MAVDIATLEAKPVEQTTEFVGTVKSRRSTDIQPQVEGFITRITAKPGQRVAAGAVLMEIDSRVQQATDREPRDRSARSASSTSRMRARKPSARASCSTAGAASQMEADRAANDLKAAEAQVRTVEEQIRTRRPSSPTTASRRRPPASSATFRCASATASRKATVLTTIDENAGLEVYINVPVQQAPKLKLGLPVRLVDDTGAVDRRPRRSASSRRRSTTRRRRCW